MQKAISNYKAELILLFATIFWGLSFPTIKIGLNYISPFLFVFIRFSVTLLIFYFVFRKKIQILNKKDIFKGIVIGIFLFLGYITQTIGLKYTTASNSAFLTGTYILIIPFVQIFIVKKYPAAENYAGIFIALTGMYFLTGINHLVFNAGDLFTFLCAVSFAFQIVMLDYYLKTTGYIALIYGQFITMSALSLITTIFFEGIIFRDLVFIPNKYLLFIIFINTIFATLLALLLANKYQKYTTPVRAGLIYNSEVVFAVLFSYIILGEVLNNLQLFGAALIITGVIVSEFTKEIIKTLKK